MCVVLLQLAIRRQWQTRYRHRFFRQSRRSEVCHVSGGHRYSRAVCFHFLSSTA